MTINLAVITTANHTCRFRMDKADHVGHLLDGLKSCAHLFSGKPLIIGSPQQTGIFAAHSIACIELETALDLDPYLPPGQNLRITALTGEERLAPFSGGFDGKHFRLRVDLCFQGGHLLSACVEGERKPALAERLTNLTSIFERPVIIYRLPLGGIGLMNPQTITRSLITPGAPDLPRDAWVADAA
jgi:hypothetical protein